MKKRRGEEFSDNEQRRLLLLLLRQPCSARGGGCTALVGIGRGCRQGRDFGPALALPEIEGLDDILAAFVLVCKDDLIC